METGFLVRVVECPVSFDWLQDVECFQHFFRWRDVFQVFSAWVQWLQQEWYGFYGILSDLYLLDAETQAEGDVPAWASCMTATSASVPSSGSLSSTLLPFLF